MGSILLIKGDSPRFYCIDLGSLTDVVQTEYPLFQWPDGVEWQDADEWLGSCRSVLCISLGDLDHFAIWNPATGSFRPLPPSNVALYDDVSYRYAWHVDSVSVKGFGYDDRNREYVLLMLDQILGLPPFKSEVSIYRSRANEWRRLQGMPYYLFRRSAMGVFLHCRLHWIMSRKSDEMMRHWSAGYGENLAKVLVAFDIRTERFEEIELPNLTNNRLRMDLAVLGKHLCLIIYNWQRGVNVWIMREYGWNGPWDRLFSIGEDQRDRWHIRTIKPLAYSQNRDRVLVDVNHERFVWYDLQTRVIEEFHRNGMPDAFDAATCL